MSVLPLPSAELVCSSQIQAEALLCQAEALLCPAEERELGFACVAVQAVQAESVDKLVNTRDLRTGDPTTRWPITRPSHVHRVGVRYTSTQPPPTRRRGWRIHPKTLRHVGLACLPPRAPHCAPPSPTITLQ